VDQCRVERALYVVVDEAVWQPVLTGALAEQCLKPVDGLGKAYLPKESE